MNKFLLQLLCLFSTSGLIAQNFVSDNFAEYMERDDITSVYVAGKTFEFASYFVEEDAEHEEIGNIRELMNSVQSLNLIVVPSEALRSDKFTSARNSISDDYDELVRVKEGKDHFSIFIDEEDDTVYEIIALGKSDDEVIAASLLCEVRIEQIEKIVSLINSKENIIVTRDNDDDQIGEIKALGEVRIYPNPASAGSKVNVDIPNHLIGAQGKMYDASGATIETFKVNGNTLSIDTPENSGGFVLLEITKDDFQVTKKIFTIQ